MTFLVKNIGVIELKFYFVEVKEKVKTEVWKYLEQSYVPKIHKYNTKQAKSLKIAMYVSIVIAALLAIFGIGHFIYATYLFISYPMAMLDNNFALEISILGGIWFCFALALWGLQYVINYYRSRWLDPDAKEIIDEQHYMKFHGWSHIVLSLLLIVGISLISLELLDYPNANEMPKNFDGLKLTMVLLVMIYGTCRLHAHRFKEIIDSWKSK